ncbi:MAG: pilus assembly protein TadG-related protein [Deltaproteobacteria bacterium]|nr:pilus assembly protein TadG-related protein [Deltaproteobacteria bacterium]
MSKKLARLMAETSGAVAVITAITLVVICGAAALAIDWGHLVSVKNELQITADASSLAGARALCTQIPGSSSFVDIPNWGSGSTTANYTLTKNAADGVLLASADIQAGFWDLTWHWSTAPKDSATGAIQLLPQGTAANPLYIPAVRVKVDKDTGVNDGKVEFSLARVMGIADASSSTQAVAAVFPRKDQGISSVPAQSCFPFATPLTWVTQHWNDDPPTSFRIGSTYHSEDGGEWTSFLIDANNVPTIRDLIVDGNPTPLTVGDNIYIQPGTKSVLYSDLAVDIGKIGLLPVVADDFSTHEYTPLLGFAAFYLEACGGSGNSAYLQGHFVKGYVDYDGTPGGTYYFGASAGTPALVR